VHPSLVDCSTEYDSLRKEGSAVVYSLADFVTHETS
jgi:hypothetical protein